MLIGDRVELVVVRDAQGGVAGVRSRQGPVPAAAAASTFTSTPTSAAPLPLPAPLTPPGDSPAETERRAPEPHPDELPKDCHLGVSELLEAPTTASPAPAVSPEVSPPRAPRLRFTRRFDRKRCWIEIDGKVASLSPALFVLLLRLALARLRGDVWAHKVDLGAKGYGWNLMSRLRKELSRQLGEAVLALIENDGDGRYWLALVADEIELVLAELAEHLNHDVRDAVAELDRAAA